MKPTETGDMEEVMEGWEDPSGEGDGEDEEDRADGYRPCTVAGLGV